MHSPSLFLIFALLAILGWCILWHRRENKTLTKHWKKNEKLPPQQREELTRLIWSRSFQLFAALAVLCLTALFYTMQISNLREELVALQNKPAPKQTAPIKKPLIRKPFIQNIPVQQTITAQKEKQPTATNPTPKTPPPAIVDVFKPSTSTTDQDAIIDTLKQQYEDTLVLYFIMDRCNHTQPDDYTLILSSLAQDMERTQAHTDLQEQIITAAQGSYKELYKRNKCKTQSMAAVAKEYRTYIDSLASAMQ